MRDLQQKAEQFKRLHVPGKPLILCNVWDAGSAKAVAKAGASAIATSSWSVAAARGYKDGEQLPREVMLANLRDITRTTDLPVSVDIESGYGKTPEDVRRTMELTLEAGAIGCNIEDSDPATGAVRELSEQVARITAVRQAAETAGIDYFINARCDLFMTAPKEHHDKALLKAVQQRAVAYAAAGASGLFVPGLAKKDLIADLAGAGTLPINVMLGDMHAPLAGLLKARVARISYGPAPYLASMQALEELAQAPNV